MAIGSTTGSIYPKASTTGSIYPIASTTGSIYPIASTTGSAYSMAIGSTYPKANILAVLGYTDIIMHIHARFMPS
jgi:hypothetical protein